MSNFIRIVYALKLLLLAVTRIHNLLTALAHRIHNTSVRIKLNPV